MATTTTTLRSPTATLQPHNEMLDSATTSYPSHSPPDNSATCPSLELHILRRQRGAKYCNELSEWTLIVVSLLFFAFLLLVRAVIALDKKAAQNEPQNSRGSVLEEWRHKTGWKISARAHDNRPRLECAAPSLIMIAQALSACPPQCSPTLAPQNLALTNKPNQIPLEASSQSKAVRKPFGQRKVAKRK